MAVDLILRVQEVDVAGGAHRLVQGLAQRHDGAVEVPQLLLALHHTLAQHVHVVADGLDLQVVVPGGDAHQFIPVLALHNGPEQLAGLAGGADDQPLPVLIDEALGHDGKALEMLQMGQGDQLIEVAQAGLVLSQHNQMVGAGGGPCPPRSAGAHGRVDLLQGMDPHVPQHLEEGAQHIGHGGRVVVARWWLKAGRSRCSATMSSLYLPSSGSRF